MLYGKEATHRLLKVQSAAVFERGDRRLYYPTDELYHQQAYTYPLYPTEN